MAGPVSGSCLTVPLAPCAPCSSPELRAANTLGQVSAELSPKARREEGPLGVPRPPLGCQLAAPRQSLSKQSPRLAARPIPPFCLGGCLPPFTVLKSLDQGFCKGRLLIQAWSAMVSLSRRASPLLGCCASSQTSRQSLAQVWAPCAPFWSRPCPRPSLPVSTPAA